MKSIKQQYIDLREGNMTQANFMRNLRMTMPQYITNITSFNDSIRILKNKGILNEVLDPTAAEEIAVAAGSYEAAVDKLMDMGLNSQEADKIANEIYPEEEEYVEDDDTYNDLRADDFRMNQLDEGFDEEGEDHSMAIEKDLEDRYSRGEITQQTLNNALDYVADHDYDLWADSLDAEYVLQQPGIVEEENIDDEDMYDDLRADDYRMNQLDESRSLREAKDEKGKWTNTSGKSMYDQFSEINNLNGQEVLIGIDYEIEKNPELTKAAAAKIVIKNLKKNPIYYTSTLMSGKEGYEPEYIGGKSANPEAHQMQYLDKNMGNVVDKKRGMQPVKGIEKPKKDSDKGGETNKAVKNIKLMSLIAKTVRGMKKMDATGEKMKKIAMRESFASWLSDKRGEEMASASSSEIHNGFKVGDTVKVNSEAASSLGIDPNDVYKIKSFTKIRPGSLMQSVDATIVDDQGTTFTVNVEYLYESGKIANTVFNKNAGITAGLKSLTKDDLMEMIRKEIAGAYGGDAMDPEDGSSYTND
jgi:hypothetical protein